ncbi:transcriptional regulator [Bacillus cereus]|uniref:helix-turn-helix domain-containing protein n=1 Tax=Bacillus cereus group TaxID=86661 RepID=UPI000BF8EB5F|nr:helix-turn-helix transcriptional regulator [Bacillus cereus]MCU5618585.1 helix-turn-helix domain-containing protein [Bacillus cereus]MEC2711564.1 helix-turn-helix transcriptional regulator [Bacillus cereus]MEC2740835.1 helix-turn-helix transcriptional regulator [Bacillus cereus]MEC2753764.1 helix-turn-helix transcriptional regulator [Bacillus cereus]MEC2828136.1 helix-turn-helix transcriptional regulator [Bacillus cereus]
MIQKNVERIRKAKGITKTHMAKKLGLTLQGYIYIANGKVRLDVERLNLISKILDVEPAIFFNEKLTDSVIKEYEAKIS